MEFPDNATAAAISGIIKEAKKAGASIHLENEHDLSEKEFELLKESYKEALQIKTGKTTATPYTDLWDE